MLMTGYLVPAAAQAAAEKVHGIVWQATIDAVTGKVLTQTPVQGGGGSLETCRATIATLQARHASSGFDPQTNTWWAHDCPEGGAKPPFIYRWELR